MKNPYDLHSVWHNPLEDEVGPFDRNSPIGREVWLGDANERPFDQEFHPLLEAPVDTVRRRGVVASD
jgi:hypothetical protein